MIALLPLPLPVPPTVVKLHPLPVLPLPVTRPLPLPMPVLPAVRDAVRVDGDAATGMVQVLLPEPDDARARVAFITAGVRMSASGLCPDHGVIYLLRRPEGGGYAYRWRN